MLREGERLENLGRGVRAIVSPAHTFGVDAVLLADFAAAAARPGTGRSPAHRLGDLGTGCGILPLLWRRAGLTQPVDAFELQPEAADMARRAVAMSGIEDVTVHTCDLRRLGVEFAGRFSLVACNPPYTPVGAGHLSRSAAARAARQETACTLGDVAGAAARLLEPGGRLCLCLPPTRLAELFATLRQNGLEPKRLRPVQRDTLSAPWLMLAEGRRGGRPGLAVEPALLMRDAQGGETAEMRRIYGECGR